MNCTNSCTRQHCIRSFGRKGSAPGEFRKPAAISALGDASGAARVVVGEVAGKRIQVLDAAGAPLQMISTLGGVPARVAAFAVDDEASRGTSRLYAASASHDAAIHVFELRCDGSPWVAG